MSGAGGEIAAAARERRVLIPERIAPPPSPDALRGLSVRQLGGETMGTTWSVKIAAPPGLDLRELDRGIRELLARIVREMSSYESGSSLCRFNAAPGGAWHRLPDSFFTVLSAALFWAEETGGAFDPTMGELVDLWGFGPAPSRSCLPDDGAVHRARARSGWKRIMQDRSTQSAFQPGGVSLDLCAIAKGFAVDEVMRFLHGRGLANTLVEIGGELRGDGVKPDGTPWWVELEKPRGTRQSDASPEMLLALSGIAIATSGDEQRYFDCNGRRYAHTLDPRTGRPIAHDLVSVTVVAEDCMTADALATALTVMGVGPGLSFARERALRARFVGFDGRKLTEHMSPAMVAMLS